MLFHAGEYWRIFLHVFLLRGGVFHSPRGFKVNTVKYQYISIIAFSVSGIISSFTYRFFIPDDTSKCRSIFSKR